MSKDKRKKSLIVNITRKLIKEQWSTKRNYKLLNRKDNLGKITMIWTCETINLIIP